MRDFQRPGRSAVYATNGMCATSHPLASHVAVQLMQDGGNALDAAIGAAVLLGLCEPQMTGLAGDCFVLIKPAGEERVVAFNGSGRAPAGLDATAMRARGLKAVPNFGVESVTMPGAVDAFCTLSKDWGRLGLERVLAPAIRYADEGVPVAPRTAFDWGRVRHLEGAAKRHFLVDGRAPVAGEVFRAPGQAEVLRRVAREGRAGFYEGEVAEDIIGSLRAAGGCHTLDDLAGVRGEYTEPVSGQYNGVELIEHAPNGQGATAILLLNILAEFGVAAMDPLGAERAHLEAEATRLAFDARNRFLADPDHTTRLAHMLAPETARRLAALIDPDRAMAQVAPLTEQVHKDTVCLSVVDGDRMAVSLIFSLFDSFGAGLASEKFGLAFQNRGSGFTLAEGHPNEAGGGKRPMHTIIPAMLREGGRITMPFGVMGGAYQPTGHARLVSNMVDFGMDLQSAIEAPRCFSGTVDGVDQLHMETGYAPDVVKALAARGHVVSDASKPLGGAQAVRIDASGVLIGGSDSRKDGCALGY